MNVRTKKKSIKTSGISGTIDTKLYDNVASAASVVKKQTFFFEMNTKYKYQLAKRGKSICPACKRKTFVLYIDNTTGNPLHFTVGKCDRADNCGHHYSPKQYYRDNHIPLDRNTAAILRINQTPKPKPSFIDGQYLEKSLKRYENNRFIQWLQNVAGFDAAKEAIERYFIGTSKHWDGATVFWQKDCYGRIRSGKIMQYDRQTGKRIKEPFNKISWVHTVLKLQDFNLSQCLFGEHLLKGNNSIVSIVESEKTAIIASVYCPNMIWLACGGCGNLSPKLCEPVRGREVILYPDAGKFAEWSAKAKALSMICTVWVSSLIEKNASDEERKAGFDLADYLVKLDQSLTAQNCAVKTKTKKEKTETFPASIPAVRQFSLLETGTLSFPERTEGRPFYPVYQDIE
jgi:hypothetical protein